MNILGQDRLKNIPSKSSLSDSRTMDSKIGRTASARTRARRVLAYNGAAKDFVSRVRAINASRKASGSSDGKLKICRLRKQSSGARLPLMSTKLKTRLGHWRASRRAVRPPIEWPIRWNFVILKWSSTADAVATRNGISVTERLLLSECPQPGASNARYPYCWRAGFRIISARSSLHEPKPCRKRIGGLLLRLWIVERSRLTPWTSSGMFVYVRAIL